MKLQGIFVDATTPFDHTGALYRVKIEHNIGKWNQTSVAGYVIGGFTGEGPLLAAKEKSELWEIAAASVGAGKLLIAGIDAEGVLEAATQINCAAGFGFQGALVEFTLIPWTMWVLLITGGLLWTAAMVLVRSHSSPPH